MSNNISKINDEEIENIFRRAISQLDEIDANANKEKRTVVKELAIELEGQIPLDTISIEIVTQLRGIVSERFIRECLDNKYKQGYRTVNANRQKEKRQKKK
jgi:tetrahydromethanopterin S-methyltransferase subunit A